MVVATPSTRRAARPSRDSRRVRIAGPARSSAPGAPGAVVTDTEAVDDAEDTEAWSRKRLREHVRDGVAVAAFSFAASSAVASLAFLALRLAG